MMMPATESDQLQILKQPVVDPCYEDRSGAYLGGLYALTFWRTTRETLRQLKEIAGEICVDT